MLQREPERIACGGIGISRRGFLSAAAVAAAATARVGRGQPVNGPSENRMDRQILEHRLVSQKEYADPFWDTQVDVIVTGPAGALHRVPAFWSGGSQWRWRFPATVPGDYRFTTEATDRSNADLHGVEGGFQIADVADGRQIGQKSLKVSANRRYLEHADGAPFFWLGDTWWMGLTKRLVWPAEFHALAANRLAKGFNVIQIVAGLYPDMPSFDQRGANEGGFPWQPDYARINPSWWEHADHRIGYLINVGLTPCIVGCWGYYLPMLGREKIERHWRYVIARWAAHPVVWCLAGEGSMPFYLSDRKEQEKAELEEGWTEMARYVRRTDPFDRPITIHPSRSGREVVRDGSVLDFDMLQTGHGDYRSIPSTLQQVAEAYTREPRMPVVQSEVCYEGIMQSCREDIQRFMFWSSILNGCCGFTYGANGIWQVNRPEAPYGPSPHGRTWGNTPWREAMQLPGGRQVGIGAEILRTLPWHRLEPHREWIDPHWSDREYRAPSAAGVPGELRVFYMPTQWDPPLLRQLEQGVRYIARLVNPSTGAAHELPPVQADGAGEHRLEHFPELRDWILILERS